jgi:5-formyltetrahydrofolate cyclo-ligase
MNKIDRLTVKYNGTCVGILSLTPDNKLCVFEYDKAWLADGFSISPLELPLKPGLFIAKPHPFYGNFGIFEPNENCELAFPNQNTLCIVPAVAFSRDGHRIGYGRGFYDRFLADFKGVSAGFSYSSLVCDGILHEDHDVPLDMIITESEVHYIVKKD